MNQTFNDASIEGKRAILSFLSEVEKSLSFKLDETYVDYLKETYHDLFKEMKLGERFFLGSLFLKEEGEISLIGSIQMVSKNENKVFVHMQKYKSGDATSYDDSCYLLWKSANHLNGIVLSMLIEHIKEISILN